MNAATHRSLEYAEDIRRDGLLSSVPTTDESLDSSRLHYYARYFGDPQARLFWREQHLWLGVLPVHGEFFTHILSSQVLDDIFTRRLLIGLRQDPSVVPGFDEIYQLDSTPRITYWHEWSPKMWRAASLRLIELFVALAELGLTLAKPPTPGIFSLTASNSPMRMPHLLSGLILKRSDEVTRSLRAFSYARFYWWNMASNIRQEG